MSADRRYRILVVPAWYPTDARPVSGIFVQDQARALAERHDVAVLAPVMTQWWRTGVRGMGPRDHVANRHGVLERHERVLQPAPRWMRGLTWRYGAAVDRGFRALGAAWARPDVIHAHVVWPAGAAAVRLGRRLGIPVVLTEHTEPFDVNLRTPWMRAEVRRALDGASRVVAVSPSLAQVMQAFHPPLHCAIIGNVVDTDFFTPAPASRPPGAPLHFLSIAMLEERKGIQFLLAAAGRLLACGLDGFRITIGGDGPMRAELEQMAARFGLGGRCEFLGRLSREQVRSQMQRCDAFVLPSQGETFGVVIAEAMACGKPVISTTCGGPEFVVAPDAGTLVPVADVPALGDAMAALMTGARRFDPDHVRASVTSRFSPEALLAQLGAIYDEVVTR